MSDFVISDGELTEYHGSSAYVIIPDGVKRIGAWVFTGKNRGVRVVKIPEGVTSIGMCAFVDTCVTEIDFPSSLTEIETSAFESSGLRKVTIPGSVKSIGTGAFSICLGLKSVEICNGVKKIGHEAFRSCDSLEHISLPDSLTSIGMKAFYGCGQLRSITLPDHLATIGEEAFFDCTFLQYVTLPAGLKTMEKRVFDECISMEAFCLSEAALSCLSCKTTGKMNAALIVTGGDRLRLLTYSSKLRSDNLTDYYRRGCMDKYDRELINNGPVYKYRLPVRLLGILGRLMDPVELSEENRAAFIKMLNKTANVKTICRLASETHHPEIVDALLNADVLEEKYRKAVER